MLFDSHGVLGCGWRCDWPTAFLDIHNLDAEPMNKPLPPEPPPMRIGIEGDTIDRAGVRRKADGTLRTWYPSVVLGWLAAASLVISLATLYGLAIADAAK